MHPLTAIFYRPNYDAESYRAQTKHSRKPKFQNTKYKPPISRTSTYIERMLSRFTHPKVKILLRNESLSAYLTIQRPMVTIHTTIFNMNELCILPTKCIYEFPLIRRCNKDYYQIQRSVTGIHEQRRIYIKIHINIAPTRFGHRPSPGSLHWIWLKLYLC